MLKKISSLWGGDSVRLENARLTAFIQSVPGAYVGWLEDGSVFSREEACTLLDVPSIQSLNDIQNALAPSDAAALEGVYSRLVADGTRFEIEACTHDKTRTLKLTGSKALIDDAPDESSSMLIIWIHDITQNVQDQQTYMQKTIQAEDDRLRLKQTLDVLPDLLWLEDDAGQIIWCNQFYVSAAGQTMARILADQIRLSFKPSKKSDAHKMLVIEGKRHHFVLSQKKLGQNQGVLHICTDITAQDEIEDQHRRYMSANNDLLENLGTAIAVFDPAQKLEFYNTAFSQLWNFDDHYLNARPKLGDIMEKMREERLLPEQADFRKFKASWVDMFTTLLKPYEDMLYLPDGRALRMLSLPPPSGGLMLTFEDVTSRLELESSYNTLVAVQKETLDNLAEGVSVFGGDGRIKLWNPAFARLWHFHPEDLEGEPHVNRLLEKMKEPFESAHWGDVRDSLLMQTLDRNIHEGQLQCKDGTLIGYSTVPLPDGGVLVTHVDVTDKMRVENALREKNAALEAAERVKIDFLANVSYQLRTPLNAIMGFTEILENEYFGSLSTKQHEYTQGIHDASTRLLSLINDILDLSSIDAGVMVLDSRPADISELMQQIYDLTAEWAQRERIQLKLDCPKDLGSFALDERRLKQALLNLMRNAIAFTPEKGTITMKALRSAKELVITVIDSGAGISKADQDRIFKPFERGTHAGRSGGAGLGLTLVKNIVEMHEGELMIESAEGKGTAVIMSLPDQKPVKKKKKAT